MGREQPNNKRRRLRKEREARQDACTAFFTGLEPKDIAEIRRGGVQIEDKTRKVCLQCGRHSVNQFGFMPARCSGCQGQLCPCLDSCAICNGLEELGTVAR